MTAGDTEAGTDAVAVFGPATPCAERYAQLLATRGVERGLIGPREAPRVWQRHLLNSVALESAVGLDIRVVDVGSGAGMPGIPLALARPDVRVDLLEPNARRCEFLRETVGELELSTRVRVVRGRAEEPTARAVVGGAQVVVARAVAALDRLVTWCGPLLEPAGRLVALKGGTAESEVREHEAAVRRAGLRIDEVRMVREVRGVVLTEPTWLVVAAKVGT